MALITARELAEELMKNPDDIICRTTDNFEQGHSTIPMTYLSLSRFEGVIEKQTFRDAFDGETYQSNVVTMKAGDKMFIKI